MTMWALRLRSVRLSNSEQSVKPMLKRSIWRHAKLANDQQICQIVEKHAIDLFRFHKPCHPFRASRKFRIYGVLCAQLAPMQLKYDQLGRIDHKFNERRPAPSAALSETLSVESTKVQSSAAESSKEESVMEHDANWICNKVYLKWTKANKWN